MPKRILVVEDDVSLLDLYNEVLTKAGYIVDLAEDGREALAKAENFKPEIIILDLMLPYIDGFEVLSQIKQSPVLKEINVIVFTNLDSEVQRKKAEDLGASQFLVKVGNDPETLLTALKKATS
ncbi:MAG TPA: response regulator [Candidatus Saccharimonadales bacterium]|nr:response regulator [Candidatus Saccharimonadales bacterium]